MVIVLAAGCEKKEDQKPLTQGQRKDTVKIMDKSQAESRIKALLGSNAQLLDEGYFYADSGYGFIAGTEKMTKEEWGIKFYCFKNTSNDLVKTYETPLLKGTLPESLIRKVRLNDTTGYEMLYYDSQNNFIGSGGGEIFAYLLDAQNARIYQSHFFTVAKMPVSLYLTPESGQGEIREFFVRRFQRDFPDLKIVKKDYDLEKDF